MKNVIVVAKNHTISLEIARSLGQAEYGVKILALSKIAGRMVGQSKYVNQVCYSGEGFEEMRRGLEMLRGAEERILVIPLNDTACMSLDQHRFQLNEHYVIPTLQNEYGGVTWFMDKTVQKETAQKCGLLVAQGKAYTTDGEGIECAVKEVSYPCFQKPLASAKSSGGSKACFARCTNQEELKKAMHTAKLHGCDTILLEEFLPIEKELTVYGVAADEKVYIPACMEAIRIHKGVAAEGIIKSTNCLGEHKEALEAFVKRLGFTGLFCIDLIKSGGQLYFSEMNLRGGGSQYAVTLAGANLPGVLADMVYSRASEKPVDIQRDVRFLNEYIELMAYKDGSVTWAEYKSHMAGRQERFVQSKEDPDPWRVYCRRVVAKNIILKKMHLR